jgi:hypothetical protein
VENAAPEEIEKGRPAASIFLDDFHEVLGKSSAKKRSAFSTFPTAATTAVTISKDLSKPDCTTIGTVSLNAGCGLESPLLLRVFRLCSG